MCRWCCRGCGGCCWSTGDQQSDIICLKYVLIGLNLFMWVFAAFMFGLGAWMKWEEAFQEWLILLGMQHYWYGVHILIWTAVLVMIIAIFGAIAASTENRKFLFLGMIFNAIVLALELAGAIYLLVNGIEDSKINTWLDDRFMELVYAYDDDPQARSLLSMIQYFVGCCGSQGAGDYETALKDTPAECRDPINGNEWDDGCGEVFSEFITVRSAWLAAFAFSLIFLQAYIIYASWRFKKELRAEEKAEVDNIYYNQ